MMNKLPRKKRDKKGEQGKEKTRTKIRMPM